MSEESAHEAIPELVEAVERGDRAALDALLPLLYGELAVMARRQRRAWHGDLTLDTTALVHEAYLKVVGQRRVVPSTRAHFFAVAAKAMRHVLCNRARDRRRQKRGGGVAPLRLAPGQDVAAPVELSDEQSETLTALDDALEALQRVAARQARVVECRFFGGMSVEDTAAALDVSPRTVKRDWTFARAWLRREMQVRLDEPG
jgi:RNA polymerase sigma factor (TIGR02999 family)